MTDRKLRRSEREALSGDAAAQVRVLVARLRAGETTRARLRVAAALGDAAAAAAVGGSGDLYAALRAADAASVLRLALAAAGEVLPLWLRLHPEREEGVVDPAATLEALRAAVRCPCAEHTRAVPTLRLGSFRDLYAEDPPLPERPLGPSLEYAADAAAQACLVAAFVARPADAAARASAAAVACVAHVLQLARRAVQEALGGADEEEARAVLRAAAQREVLPWLLGEADPLSAPPPPSDLLARRRPAGELYDPAWLGRCAGEYRRGETRYAVFFVRGALRLRQRSPAREAPPVLLRPEVRRAFRVGTEPRYVEFVFADDAGPATALRLSDRVRPPRTAPRVG